MPIPLLTAQLYMVSTDCSYPPASNKISSRTLLQIIQSVKLTRNYYVGLVHPTMREVQNTGNQEVALHPPFAIGNSGNIKSKYLRSKSNAFTNVTLLLICFHNWCCIFLSALEEYTETDSIRPLPTLQQMLQT